MVRRILGISLILLAVSMTAIDAHFILLYLYAHPTNTGIIIPLMTLIAVIPGAFGMKLLMSDIEKRVK